MVWVFALIAIVVSLMFLASREHNKDIKKIFLRPSFLFIIAFLIVFFQRPIDYVLRYNFTYLQLGEVQYMLKSMQYATMGLCLFCMGYLVESKRDKGAKTRVIHLKIVNPRFYVVLSSLLIVFVLILVPKSVLMGGYSNDLLTNASIYNYLSSWSNVILIAYIVQFTVNIEQTEKLKDCSVFLFIKELGIWYNMNVLLYTYLILNVGDRGPLIVLAFAYYISYMVVSKKQLPKWQLIVILCVGIFISSVLGDTKQYRGNNTIIERLESVFKNETDEPQRSFLPVTDQLSGSYCCLPLALQMISNHSDFTYGWSLLSDFFSGIPFIGRFLNLPESSSYRISEFALGKDFSFGLGTNCIASLYMDGGILFIILGMFIFGFLLRKFEVCIFSETTVSFFVFCMAFYFLTHLVYIPRSTLFSPFKYALWMYVIMALYAKIAPSSR